MRARAWRCGDIGNNTINTTVTNFEGTFAHGWLVVPNGTAECGGIGDPRAADPNAVSLCQSIAYNVGVGNLALFLTLLPALQGLTIPATLILLGLPFRW